MNIITKRGAPLLHLSSLNFSSIPLSLRRSQILRDLWSMQAEALRGAHQVRERLDSHLLHYLATVDLDRLLTGSEVGRKLLVELPGRQLAPSPRARAT